MTMSRAAVPGLRLAAVAALVVAAGAGQAQGRFTVSADGQEVTDAQTRLTWRRCAEGLRWDGNACSGKLLKTRYAGAKEQATKRARDEGKPWRIPSREELTALLDMTRKKPRIDADAFPQTPSSPFWASRPGTDDDLNAYLVSFSNGKTRANLGQAKFATRLVRASS